MREKCKNILHFRPRVRALASFGGSWCLAAGAPSRRSGARGAPKLTMHLYSLKGALIHL